MPALSPGNVSYSRVGLLSIVLLLSVYVCQSEKFSDCFDVGHVQGLDVWLGFIQRARVSRADYVGLFVPRIMFALTNCCSVPMSCGRVDYKRVHVCDTVVT